MAKEKTKYEIVSVYDLDDRQKEELYIKDWDELSLFEWDPDYMVTPWADDNYMTESNHIYFFIWKDENIIVTSTEDFDYKDELLEFCEGQDPTISKWWFNTRSETNHWQYLEENTWDGREKCKNLKIAYRGWCGYVYTLFEYLPSKEKEDE